MDGLSAVYENSFQLQNLPVLVPFETIEEKNQKNLNDFKKLKLQICLDQIDQLNRLETFNYPIQIWIDQSLQTEQIDLISKYKNEKEIVFVPNGFFDIELEIQKVQKLNWNCSLIIPVKKSIHDSWTRPEILFLMIMRLKEKKIDFNLVFLKKNFDSMTVKTQNLFLNPHPENVEAYMNDSSKKWTFHFFKLVDLENLMLPLFVIYNLRFDHKRDLYINKLKSIFHHLKMLFIKIKIFIMNLRYKFYPFLLIVTWPLRKIYWAFKYQYKKRILKVKK